MRNRLLQAGVALLFQVASLPAIATGQGQPVRAWQFEVLLDGKPIGFHRFELDGGSDVRLLRSEARFRVKMLGLTVYEYTHHSNEWWNNDCLQKLDARTDDNGSDLFVRGSTLDRKLLLEHNDGNTALTGCVMTFAYWNPDILEQERLLNVQTGKYPKVRVQKLGKTPLRVREVEVSALHYRISTGKEDIELWYSEDRDWLGLRSVTPSGRQLLYRRIPDTETTGDKSSD